MLTRFLFLLQTEHGDTMSQVAWCLAILCALTVMALVFAAEVGVRWGESTNPMPPFFR